ncbi:MAG: ribonuclease Y [Phycisphaerales bacterium]|nr:MAG: ribonuclease Y [Phycisphaerales bacterium]
MGFDVLAESTAAVTTGVAFLAFALGASAMYAVLHYLGKLQIAAAQAKAEAIVAEAKADAEQIRKTAEVDARDEFIKKMDEFEKESADTRRELKEIEKRLAKREDNFEAKLDTLVAKEKKLDQRQQQVDERAAALKKLHEEADTLLVKRREELQRISGMSAEQGRELLLSQLKTELEQESAQLVAESVAEAKEEAKTKSRDIILTAIQRYAAEHTSEGTVSTVTIPSDDMKGRVIGREGRNIRAFEKVTGVDVIVDDTPGVVVVSSFDPVRREKARASLERLIQDGRIHPGRIEEVFNEVTREVDQDIIDSGKAAAMEAHVGGLHRKLIDLMGRLKWRTSYGQNVLRHSIEVAFLCQAIADELGLDGRLARRCGFLHDVGKAVDHEIEGGHPKIGADICRRLRERPEVLNAIEGHHGDVESTSPYTPIVMAADAISAARPGGRRESLERYIQRLRQFEEIATAHNGVKEAYAIQAGREVRVIVDAKKVDDALAAKLARDIAVQVESEMTYPGEIKVTVLREVRAVEFAK